MPFAPRILCVHQGGELYGSDRSFLQAVEALRQGWPAAHIRVLLAADGPLRARLAAFADEVVVRDLFVLRLATPVSTSLKATIGLLWYVAAARREIARVDLAYVNTVVITDFMLAARLARRKTVIHAREIPKSRAILVVRGLIRLASTHMIYNSQATKDALAPDSAGGVVIYNGTDEIAGATPPSVPASGFSAERPLRIVMLGRINDWKGQDVLVGAAALLSAHDRMRVRVRVIGSTYGKATAPIDALQAQIVQAGLKETVSLEPFMEDPGEAYRWADLCAVPSRLPEPFGRVAIEAMAEARGVLAAKHGGLVEIVEEGRSGRLLPPGDSAALAGAIRTLLANPLEVECLGAGALARFTEHFTVASMAQQLQLFASTILGARCHDIPPELTRGGDK